MGKALWANISEIDLVGLLLIALSVALILVPLTITNSALNSWRSASVIAMIVIGFCLLFAVVAWEGWFAKVGISLSAPYELIRSHGRSSLLCLGASYETQLFWRLASLTCLISSPFTCSSRTNVSPVGLHIGPGLHPLEIDSFMYITHPTWSIKEQGYFGYVSEPFTICGLTRLNIFSSLDSNTLFDFVCCTCWFLRVAVPKIEGKPSIYAVESLAKVAISKVASCCRPCCSSSWSWLDDSLQGCKVDFLGLK